MSKIGSKLHDRVLEAEGFWIIFEEIDGVAEGVVRCYVAAVKQFATCKDVSSSFNVRFVTRAKRVFV